MPFHTARKTRRPARRVAFRPRLESLELRDCPAGGTLDPTFGSGGTVTVATAQTDFFEAVSVQTDGKVVSVGTVVRTTGFFGSTTQVAVTRLNANGTPDATFGTGGTVKLPVGLSATGRAVAIQPDGKIVLTASATVSSTDTGEYAVARLNANGTLDATFGTAGGWWLSNPSAGAESLNKIAVAVTGSGFSIVAAGQAPLANGTNDFAAVRLTSAGLPDATFGTNGVARMHLGTGTNVTNGLAVTASGGVAVAGFAAVAGQAGQFGGIVVWDATGHLNTAFNGTGTVIDRAGGPYGGGQFIGLAAQGDSLITLGGCAPVVGQPPVGVIGRYTPAGTIDTTFATNGYFLTAPQANGPTSFTTGDVKVKADGSLIVLGRTTFTDAGRALHAGFFLSHLSTDGILDTTFGTSGTGYVTQQADETGITLSLAVGPDGRIVVGTRQHLLRFIGP